MINKKKKILLIFTFFLFSFSIFATNANFGFAYDTFNSENFGIFGGISSKLSKKTDLSASLEYFGGNNYRALIAADYNPFSFSKISGGCTLSIDDNQLIPGFYSRINLFTPKFFDFAANMILGLNPNNILQPNNFLAETQLAFTTTNAILKFNIGYQQKKALYFQKIIFDTILYAYDSQSPIKISLEFYTQTILNQLEVNPLNFIFDIGFSTEYKKNTSSTILNFKTRAFNLRELTAYPFLVSISKKVTF